MDSHHTVILDLCMDLVFGVRATEIDYRMMIRCLVALVMALMMSHLLTDQKQQINFMFQF